MFSLLVLSLVVTQGTPQKLRWEPKVDIPVTGTLIVAWGLSEIAFKRQLTPEACRWCQTNGFDLAVRTLFNPTLTPSAQGFGGVDLASNLIGFAALPLAMLGIDALLAWQAGSFAETYPVDLALILEATFSILDVNQATKFIAARARPFSIGASPELLAQGKDLADSRLSFFSGHSTFTFALVSSAATIASLRGYKYAWVLWAVGLPLATTTAILRLGADKHWATDVMLGSALGLATGILMPTLLHGRVGPVTARVTPTATGVVLAGQF